jgi:TldD protein
LSDIKPVLKELLDELLKKYPYASILAQDNYAKDYSVSAQGTVIKENELLTGRGFVVRVFDEEIAEFSFNDISKGTLGMILTKIERNLSQLKANVPGLIHRKKIKVNKLFIEKLDGVDKIEFDKSTPFEIDPRTVKDKDVVKKLTKASEAGRALKYDNANVIDCQVRFNYQCIDKLFLSKNKDLRQHITWTVGAFVTIV